MISHTCNPFLSLAFSAAGAQAVLVRRAQVRVTLVAEREEHAGQASTEGVCVWVT